MEVDFLLFICLLGQKVCNFVNFNFYTHQPKKGWVDGLTQMNGTKTEYVNHGQVSYDVNRRYKLMIDGTTRMILYSIIEIISIP